MPYGDDIFTLAQNAQEHEGSLLEMMKKKIAESRAQSLRQIPGSLQQAGIPGSGQQGSGSNPFMDILQSLFNRIGGGQGPSSSPGIATGAGAGSASADSVGVGSLFA